MKILYGVQGTGNGHISRTRMMAKHFAQRNDVEVTYLFSGRARQDYFDMEVFGDYQCRKGLTFQVEGGQLSYFKTFTHNNLLAFRREVRALDLAPYDLVITDFEPVTAWAAKYSGCPVLGIGHQYAFAHAVPREGENILSRLLMRKFAPAGQALGLHWDSFGGQILPPIVDDRLGRLAADLGRQDDKVIVYLPFENQQKVTALLRKIPQYRFFQYSSCLVDGQQANVQLRKSSHDGFLRDLCSSSAVICNAGFELVSECLQLGLNVLVKPLHGQPEQLSNAAALIQLHLGSRMEALRAETMRDWLASLRTDAQAPVKANYPDVAAALVEWIVDRQRSDPAGLVERLWKACENSSQIAG